MEAVEKKLWTMSVITPRIRASALTVFAIANVL